MLVNMANAAEQAAGFSKSGLYETFVPFILIFIIFYFLLIRPEKKRQNSHKQMLSELKKGQKVITSGGMIGKISSITDEIVKLEIAENVEIEVMKATIATLVENSDKKAEKK